MQTQDSNGNPSDVNARIDDTADALKSRVEALKARVSDLRARGDAIAENLARAVRAHPLRSVAIALGAGFLGAKVLRR